MHQNNVQNEQENTACSNFNILLECLAACFFLLIKIYPQNEDKGCMVFGWIKSALEIKLWIFFFKLETIYSVHVEYIYM